MSKYRKVFIIPYFGSFPHTFNLWMQSCSYNTGYDFLIITDCQVQNEHPSNIIFVSMSFSKLKEHMDNIYGFQVALESAYKLCDFRPGYGEIFKEYITDYDYWGYCDIDVIFGDIDKYITDDILEDNEKILSLGHFTLFKNDEYINTLYRSDKNADYITIFQDKNNRHFDEGLFDEIIPMYEERGLNPVWLYDKQNNINQIFAHNSRKIYINFTIFADINFLEDNLQIVWMSCLESKDPHANQSVFVWDHGHVFRYYIDKMKICREEFMYIHLQKRRMENRISESSPKRFYILKNSCEEIKDELTMEFLKRSNINKLSFKQRKEKISTFFRHNRHRILVKLKRKYNIDIKKLFGKS